MKTPWAGRTGFAKAVAILVTGFTISAGLCGMNFGAWALSNRGGGGRWAWAQQPLILAGLSELAGMGISFAGLVIVGLLGAVRSVWPRSRPPNSDGSGQ